MILYFFWRSWDKKIPRATFVQKMVEIDDENCLLVKEVMDAGYFDEKNL